LDRIVLEIGFVSVSKEWRSGQKEKKIFYVCLLRKKINKHLSTHLIVQT